MIPLPVWPCNYPPQSAVQVVAPQNSDPFLIKKKDIYNILAKQSLDSMDSFLSNNNLPSFDELIKSILQPSSFYQPTLFDQEPQPVKMKMNKFQQLEFHVNTLGLQAAPGTYTVKAMDIFHKSDIEPIYNQHLDDKEAMCKAMGISSYGLCSLEISAQDNSDFCSITIEKYVDMIPF